MLTRLGELPESRLRKRIDAWDTADQYVEATEYCLLDCPGEAHVTGRASGDGSFCPLHVSRSVHVTVKRYPEGECSGALAKLG